MRYTFLLIGLLSFFVQAQPAQEDIEFVCFKTHKASNTCHFNFKVSGAPFRYVDIGCKYAKKKEEVIRKVKEGEIFLAKDWKIACPEQK